MDDSDRIDVPQADGVEPDIRHYLDNPGPTGPNIYTASHAEIRAHYRTTRNPHSVPEVGEVVDTHFDGPEGSVAVRIYRSDPVAAAAPAVLWFHGGGWVVGDLFTAELPARVLATEGGCTVVSVDYRLAPETKFPGAYDDSAAAMVWVRRNAKDLRIDPDRLIVGGDSAGGTLAAAVAIAERDADRALLGQLLIYPAVQIVPKWADRDHRSESFLLGGADMDWYIEQYIPVGADLTDWRLAPIHAELAGTAEAFVQTCGFDILAEEGLHYAQQLAQSGVSVVIDHLPGAVHGIFAMEVDAGTRARSAAAAWLIRRFSGE